MNITYKLIGLLLFFAACNNSTEPLTENVGASEEPESVLLVQEILSANPAVKVGALQSEIVQQSVACTGRVEIPPTELLSVHSKVEGFVEEINYLPGDFVKKGAPLLTVVNTALIEKQRILLETKAELSLAEKEFVRRSTLQAESATSQKVFDETQSRKEFLSAKYTGLKTELQLIGIDVVRLENEQLFQSRLSVFAAESGYVHEVLINTGQRISPQDKLMDIANNDHVHLELKVLSKDVPFLKVGQPVLFSLPNNPAIFNASIVKLNPMLDSETQTLMVHCHIATDQQKDIKAGMFVNAFIEVDARELRGLPLSAVVKEGDKYFAYVVEGDLFKKQLLQDVEVMDDFVSFAQIPRENLVIAGAYYLE
ncbi:MAG: efflux RND transporter periplasmic adaptor subunit [Saprospiraceae bacterium]|nr:efflux RND transporter periplasmic adaptor subunit [Saprospiraceae bacterium]